MRRARCCFYYSSLPVNFVTHDPAPRPSTLLRSMGNSLYMIAAVDSDSRGQRCTACAGSPPRWRRPDVSSWMLPSTWAGSSFLVGGGTEWTLADFRRLCDDNIGIKFRSPATPQCNGVVESAIWHIPKAAKAARRCAERCPSTTPLSPTLTSVGTDSAWRRPSGRTISSTFPLPRLFLRAIRRRMFSPAKRKHSRRCRF